MPPSVGKLQSECCRADYSGVVAKLRNADLSAALCIFGVVDLAPDSLVQRNEKIVALAADTAADGQYARLEYVDDV